MGVGNIARVATAIALGGPGAVFWMWCTGLVGMATKYSEAFLGVRFRRRRAERRPPMHYHREGIKGRLGWFPGRVLRHRQLDRGLRHREHGAGDTVAENVEDEWGLEPWSAGLITSASSPS